MESADAAEEASAALQNDDDPSNLAEAEDEESPDADNPEVLEQQNSRQRTGTPDTTAQPGLDLQLDAADHSSLQQSAQQHQSAEVDTQQGPPGPEAAGFPAGMSGASSDQIAVKNNAPSTSVLAAEGSVQDEFDFARMQSIRLTDETPDNVAAELPSTTEADTTAAYAAALANPEMHPDHPLLARAQRSLAKQLLAIKYRLEAEVREKAVALQVRSAAAVHMLLTLVQMSDVQHQSWVYVSLSSPYLQAACTSACTWPKLASPETTSHSSCHAHCAIRSTIRSILVTLLYYCWEPPALGLLLQSCAWFLPTLSSQSMLNFEPDNLPTQDLAG